MCVLLCVLVYLNVISEFVSHITECTYLSPFGSVFTTKSVMHSFSLQIQVHFHLQFTANAIFILIIGKIMLKFWRVTLKIICKFYTLAVIQTMTEKLQYTHMISASEAFRLIGLAIVKMARLMYMCMNKLKPIFGN